MDRERNKHACVIKKTYQDMTGKNHIFCTITFKILDTKSVANKKRRDWRGRKSSE